MTVNDPDGGQPWDLSKHAERAILKKLVTEGEPFVAVVGSQPCVDVCPLQALSAGRQDPNVKAERLAKAKVRIKTCMEIYALQVRAGRYFVHEHPLTATSWKMPEVEEVAQMDGVRVVSVDMCQFGLTVRDAQGQARPARKDFLMKLLAGISFPCFHS